MYVNAFACPMDILWGDGRKKNFAIKMSWFEFQLSDFKWLTKSTCQSNYVPIEQLLCYKIFVIYIHLDLYICTLAQCHNGI